MIRFWWQTDRNDWSTVVIDGLVQLQHGNVLALSTRKSAVRLHVSYHSSVWLTLGFNVVKKLFFEERSRSVPSVMFKQKNKTSWLVNLRNSKVKLKELTISKTIIKMWKAGAKIFTRQHSDQLWRGIATNPVFPDRQSVQPHSNLASRTSGCTTHRKRTRGAAWLRCSCHRRCDFCRRIFYRTSSSFLQPTEITSYGVLTLYYIRKVE